MKDRFSHPPLPMKPHRNPGGWKGRSLIRLAAGCFPALFLWATLSPCFGGEEFDYFIQGKKLVQDGKLDQAVTQFEKALAINPKDPVINDWLGSVYYDLGNPAKAEIYLQAGSNSGQPWPYYLGMSLLKKGDWESAQPVLQKGLFTEKKPEKLKEMQDALQKIDGFQEHFKLGNEAFAINQYKTAESEYSQALAFLDIPVARTKLEDTRRQMVAASPLAGFFQSMGGVGTVLIAVLVAAGAVIAIWAFKSKGKKAPAAMKKGKLLETSAEGQGAPGLLNGRYENLQKIGEGGMGVVFKAKDVRFLRPVALKKMREELNMVIKAKKQFLGEAERVAKLNHPRIVTIYEWFEEDKDIYLVFEFVDGKALNEVIAENERIEPAKTVDFSLQVCDALSFAHQEGILHQDLKPSNVMLAHGRHVKVMDFGVAREVKNTVANVSGKIPSGTFAYMAPEQEMGRPGKPSDIYSMGICMYEMLTGELPFPGPNYLAQKERCKFKPLKEAVPGIPGDLEKIVEKCLQVEPGDRFQSMDSLIESLEKVKP